MIARVSSTCSVVEKHTLSQASGSQIRNALTLPTQPPANPTASSIALKPVFAKYSTEGPLLPQTVKPYLYNSLVFDAYLLQETFLQFSCPGCTYRLCTAVLQKAAVNRDTMYKELRRCLAYNICSTQVISLLNLFRGHSYIALDIVP